jgi:hypothetical protein
VQVVPSDSGDGCEIERSLRQKGEAVHPFGLFLRNLNRRQTNGKRPTKTVFASFIVSSDSGAGGDPHAGTRGPTNQDAGARPTLA